MRCERPKCDKKATIKICWLGQEPLYVCEDCCGISLMISKGMGFHLHIEDFEVDEVEKGERGMKASAQNNKECGLCGCRGFPGQSRICSKAERVMDLVRCGLVEGKWDGGEVCDFYRADQEEESEA